MERTGRGRGMVNERVMLVVSVAKKLKEESLEEIP